MTSRLFLKTARPMAVPRNRRIVKSFWRMFWAPICVPGLSLAAGMTRKISCLAYFRGHMKWDGEMDDVTNARVAAMLHHRSRHAAAGRSAGGWDETLGQPVSRMNVPNLSHVSRSWHADMGGAGKFRNWAFWRMRMRPQAAWARFRRRCLRGCRRQEAF
jgi:hypothetical protein